MFALYTFFKLNRGRPDLLLEKLLPSNLSRGIVAAKVGDMTNTPSHVEMKASTTQLNNSSFEK